MDLLSSPGAAAEVGYPVGIPQLDLREASVPSDHEGRVVVEVVRSAAPCPVSHPEPAGSRTGAPFRDVVRATLAGLWTVTQVAADDVWSALRLS